MEATDTIERTPAVCPTCGKAFAAAIFRSPFDPSRILCQARYCDPCVTRQREERRVREESEHRAEWEAKRRAEWESLCSREFRTLAEGGKTDVARLLAEHPMLQQVIDHDLGDSGLIVRGKSGHGKTRAAWRLLRRAFDGGKRIMAMTSGEFDRAARDAGGRFHLTEWVESLVRVDVLFLDDLGKAPWTPATVGIWFDVLDGRYRESLPIVVTTNLDGAALVSQLRIGPDIGEPMLRRMREMTRGVVVR